MFGAEELVPMELETAGSYLVDERPQAATSGDYVSHARLRLSFYGNGWPVPLCFPTLSRSLT